MTLLESLLSSHEYSPTIPKAFFTIEYVIEHLMYEISKT